MKYQNSTLLHRFSALLEKLLTGGRLPAPDLKIKELSAMPTQNYFSEKETRCPDNCGMDIRPEFREKLNELRKSINRPLTLTSAARCPIHNAKVGGASASQHINGVAADIKAWSAAEKYEIVSAAIKLGFTGIGIHDKFIHVDTGHQVKVMWLY